MQLLELFVYKGIQTLISLGMIDGTGQGLALFL